VKGDIIIDYTNWRGERAKRRIAPASIFWGATEWHPDEQWHLLALDLDRDVERVFAMKDIHGWEPCPTGVP
jgi:hypothetical protein